MPSCQTTRLVQVMPGALPSGGPTPGATTSGALASLAEAFGATTGRDPRRKAADGVKVGHRGERTRQLRRNPPEAKQRVKDGPQASRPLVQARGSTAARVRSAPWIAGQGRVRFQEPVL